MVTSEILDYALEAFWLKVEAGDTPTFGECVAQALYAHDEISDAELERYKHERARQCDCEIKQCQNGPS